MVSPLGVQGMQAPAVNSFAGRSAQMAPASAGCGCCAGGACNRNTGATPASSNNAFDAMPALGGSGQERMSQMLGLMVGMMAMSLMGLMMAVMGGGLLGQAPAGTSARMISASASSGQGALNGEGGLMVPIQGLFRKTSDFGHRHSPTGDGLGTEHTGMDLAALHGEPILATADGVVGFAGDRGDGLGNHVVLNHGDGLESLYGHMSSITVPPGSRVRKGQIIGHVGSTGYSTGPHLHLEFRRNGVPFDPRQLFPQLS